MPARPLAGALLRALLPAALLLAAPALAQQGTSDTSGVLGIEGGDDREPVDAKSWPWVAIGQVNREIGGHCTGALIAPDRVLTAAHCLYNFGDGRWTIPFEVHFVAGYDRGRYLEHARAKRFAIAPGWDAGQATAQGNLGNDWAVIELERPLSIRPIALSDRGFAAIRSAAEEGELAIAAYNGDFGEILTRDKGCALAGETGDAGLILHGCDATYGASGAPLLLVTRDGAEIIGLQSAVVEMQDGRTFGAAVPVANIRAAGALN